MGVKGQEHDEGRKRRGTICSIMDTWYMYGASSMNCFSVSLYEVSIQYAL